jgi:hypothetical protein
LGFSIDRKRYGFEFLECPRSICPRDRPNGTYRLAVSFDNVPRSREFDVMEDFGKPPDHFGFQCSMIEFPDFINRHNQNPSEKARRKLKYQAFLELNHRIGGFFENRFCVKTWHGFRLLAADGSTLRLPHTEDIRKHFGAWKVRQKYAFRH